MLAPCGKAAKLQGYSLVSTNADHGLALGFFAVQVSGSGIAVVLFPASGIASAAGSRATVCHELGATMYDLFRNSRRRSSEATSNASRILPTVRHVV